MVNRRNCTHGVFGRYVDVDLSSGVSRDYEVPDRWSVLHLGGRGIAARILLEETRGTEDPFSADNVIVLATGPFQGTGLAGAGRHVVMAISPKTGSVAESYVGGYFGHVLAQTGYDGAIIRGKAPEPVYLALLDGSVELRSAKHLWGLGTGETETRLKEAHPECRVASIGIAGERLVHSACVIHDRNRSAGRVGLGGVFGAKLLKAVVVRGKEKKHLYDSARFARERVDYTRELLEGPLVELGEHGTASFVGPLSELGILPTRNFQKGCFEGAKAIDGRTLSATILKGRDTCAGCPIRCKRVVQASYDNIPVLPAFGGPEYETVAAFGSLCCNDDLMSIALANQLCNDYGLDTISIGVACAFLMEVSENGLISERFRWGDGHAILKIIRMIAHREGIGDSIANGLEAFAKELGADCAMTIKGVEVPMHEPRGKQGLAISYATSHRGATHTEGVQDTMLEIEDAAPELGIHRRYDRFDLKNKTAAIKIFEDLRSFDNSIILCMFIARSLGPQYRYPRIRSLLEAVTGIELSVQEMLRTGERNYILMRLHAARAGYTSHDDILPHRFHTPIEVGNSSGRLINPDELEAALGVYRSLRGCDEFGPTDETLRRLELAEYSGVIPR